MKSVLISIHPRWCDLIASGKKTIEVRKSCPKIETPFKCYIYETKARSDMPTFVDEDGHVLYTGRGQVIGEFVCDRIDIVASICTPCMDYITVNDKWDTHFSDISCLNVDELGKYLGFNKDGYGWHISDLKIYDNPLELSEFWAYNEVLHKRYDSDINFCCYNDTNEYGEEVTDCGDAFNNILNCYHCWEEWSGWCHHVNRPPQSWCYVEELQWN